MERRSGARSLMAALFVVLGLIIVGRGIAEAAPLTFTLMGLLMIVLGIYRWRIIRAGIGGRR